MCEERECQNCINFSRRSFHYADYCEATHSYISRGLSDVAIYCSFYEFKGW